MLILATDKLIMHFVLYEVTTKEIQTEYHFPQKTEWEKNTSSIQKRRQERGEKDGTSKHTKKDGRHTSKYTWPWNTDGFELAVSLIRDFFKNDSTHKYSTVL